MLIFTSKSYINNIIKPSSNIKIKWGLNIIRREFITNKSNQLGIYTYISTTYRKLSTSSTAIIVDKDKSNNNKKKKDKKFSKSVFFGLVMLMPIITFGLGTWQVKRLDWKMDLIARAEEQLAQPPLPLPLHVDPLSVPSFEFRRVYTFGKFRHDQEMLVGPRVHEGKTGYHVITPLEIVVPGSDKTSKVLVNRGWIDKDVANQKLRSKKALPKKKVYVEAMLRVNPEKPRFTLNNEPEMGEFYFVDVDQMAKLTGSDPIYLTQISEPIQDENRILSEESKRIKTGVPLGFEPKLEIRNNHFQYIITWYGLCLATTIMLAFLMRRPRSAIEAKMKHAKDYA